MPDRQECEVCGAEKLPEMVDHTTVAPIAPLEADICRACQLVQDHDLPEGVCMQCGDPVETGFPIELEFPLGPADLPGRLTGILCGDCAGWIACDINYDAIDADEEAHEAFIEVLEKKREREAELEGSA
ncbi:hypothetical protein [Halorhabdus amylolytica]|uniref:hypothetical protein n=1 Tax=Halorhabdus amylolytica TaxID=2559573 RepID=UPI0010AA3544|nr:hypothetical protein [Halorhabdus amylolytica]